MNSQLVRSAFAAAVALTLQSAQSQPSDMQKLIESFGFEYRPKQEIPWGVKLGDADDFIWVEIKGTRFLSRKADGLSRLQLHDRMLEYLNKYARKEVELIATLLLRSPTKYDASFIDVFPTEQHLSIVDPPAHQFTARLPDIIVGGKEYMISCTFLFIEVDGLYKSVIAKRGPYQQHDSIVEPHCDLH